MEPCVSCFYLTYCIEYVWKSSLWIGIFQRATQRPTIYRVGAAVVSTTPCIIKWHDSGIIIRNIDNSVWFFWLEMRLRHHVHVNVVIYHISFQGYNRSEFVLSFHKTVNVRKNQLRNSKLISSSRNRRSDRPLACVASVSVWFRSKERSRNGISVLAAREMK